MTNCKQCGADLALVGSVHRCVPRAHTADMDSDCNKRVHVMPAAVRGTYKYRDADAWRSYMANYMRGYRRKQRETD